MLSGDAVGSLKVSLSFLETAIIYPAMLCPDCVRTIWRCDIELLSLQTSPHDLVIYTNVLSDKFRKRNCQLVKINVEAADFLP